MSLKKIITIIGGVALLATAAGGLNSAPADSLEQVVMQEAAQQQVQVDEQKYDEMKKMFDEADGVARGVVEKVSVEYDKLCRNISTMYYLKNVNIYKFHKKILSQSKRWGVTSLDGLTFTQASMPVLYQAIKPGTDVPADVMKAAEKTGTTPVFDEKTPDFKPGNGFVVFIQNPDVRGKKLGLINYVPLGADSNNLNIFKRILSEYNITDNYDALDVK